MLLGNFIHICNEIYIYIYIFHEYYNEIAFVYFRVHPDSWVIDERHTCMRTPYFNTLIVI